MCIRDSVTCAQKHDAKSFSGLNYGQKASVKIWWNLEHCRVSLWQYLILALKPIGNGLAGQKCQKDQTCRHASKVWVTQDQVQVVMMTYVLRLCWKVEWLGSESSCNIGPEMAWDFDLIPYKVVTIKVSPTEVLLDCTTTTTTTTTLQSYYDIDNWTYNYVWYM